ncbi:hypothetical protein JOB18_045758 [Solea senegalensis]|uniref:Nance-Horan syndrome a (congenital cataracts and dental anomalies) n=2 Tax=Solea senegalensis TaxID=28829 RepID=A0AAV6SBK9_SOLSE|nr:Nance-Horan syndrome protein isoform X1 [Solea senegalensis]KAG7514929.1 hypothetical protein JOB18_045758 [Solea senegalensis]
MPFAKRVVEPQFLCRHHIPNSDGLLFEDLVCTSHVSLSRTLRQLSDLAKHACSIFQELEGDLASTSLRVRGLQRKIGRLQETCSGLDPKQEPVPVSNLDVESKLTTHHRAPWQQQRNVLHPSTRPACVDELHGRAELNLWMLHRDQQRGRSGSSEHRVTISISAVPPMPLYPSPHLRATGLTTFESTRSSSPTECCRLSPWSRKATPSDPDTDGVTLGHRSKFPIPNAPSTLDKQTNWSKALPLPTPEERMKSESQVIGSCVVPINVTGVVFDRDASVRCSLVHSQSLLQRRRKLRRRRTVAGVPRQLQHDLDSDESPGSRERTVIVHSSPDITPSNEELDCHLSTRDSGCQTEDFLISGAPSRRRIRTQRVQGGVSLSRSAGNISSLTERTDAMFTASLEAQLRSRSLPRDASRILDSGRNDSEEEEEEEEEDFLPAPGTLLLKDEEEESMDEQASGLTYQHLSDSPEHIWMERTCEISSSSDTFSSPVHSVSAAAALTGHMDHKDDHQSSSGNWSGSSSTCPSQTSETLPPAASPPLTGSSHCDSELSLNAATHNNDDPAGFVLDHYQGLRTQRTGSFSSTAMDILEEAGVSPPLEQEWNYTRAEPPRSQDFSPEPSLGCPSFTSMVTCESSFSDKPPSEKADTVSHYSVDTEGYYTSMHFDCGLKESRSFTYNNNHNYSLSDLSGHMTLTRRCLSLRKPKAKPSPPKRSSSLRKICSEENFPDHEEPKISCGQQLPSSSTERRLQLVLPGAAGHMENSSLSSEPFVVWGVEDQPDFGAFRSTDAHSFKDEGVVQSDYADLWLLSDFKSSDPYRSLSNSSTATGTTVVECVRSQESSESQSGSRATTPSLPSVEGEFRLTSPEKLGGLASPSSGYSSQSETPTSSSFPSAFFPGPLSPTGHKRKPKVPERKSSLSSLSLHRDAAAPTKRNLELPMIPPSHLDLSVLHCVNKVSDYRTQIQILQQNKQKPAVTAKPEAFSPAHTMTITPTVLHSVQLRSIEDKTPKCPTSHLHHTSSEEAFMSPPEDDAARHQQDGDDGVLESAAAVHELRSEPLDVCDVTTGQEEDVCRETRTETCEDHVCLSSAALLSSVRRSDSVDSPLQETHVSARCFHDDGDNRDDECESSGVSAQTSLKDEKDESMPGTEDDFTQESTPSETDSRSEDDGVFVSPTRSRTTEDLFAMIHRSKRKVLGRKDSGEVAARNRLNAASASTPPGGSTCAPSSPLSAALPASSAATPPGLQRVSGPIYRNAKKSSTSNEEFKLLLLRKGSRSDSSYRMSATEILKSPVTPKSHADSLIESPRQPDDGDADAASPSPSPLSSDQLFFPRANAEGFSPKSFPVCAASRQGRSRIPPPANSSRYGARSRLYSAPMQAISEGETENSDGSPHDERPAQGST